MLVFITGGGRTGAQLAAQLLQQNYEVRLVEHRRELLARLHHELPTEVIYEGQATDPNVLKQAGIEKANVLVASTNDDDANLVICYLARTLFKTRRTVARINNPRNAWLFDKNFHVDETINQADVMAHLIQEEMSLGDMMTIFKIRRGHYSVVEEKVPPGAKAIGIPLKDMALAEHCVIAAIIRDGVMTLPRGDSLLQENDEIIAVASPQGAQKLAEMLAHPVYPVRNGKQKE